MRVVIAPDSFKGTLTAREAAAAIAAGWRAERPHDELVVVPVSDGGDGLLDVLEEVHGGAPMQVEVADPLGHPRRARILVDDATAVVEAAEACGLALLPPEHRNPLHTTTYGVGQLLEAARRSGVRRVLVGLGGSATVDGGAGALTALGFRLTTEDGSGLKIGGGELHRVAHVEPRWVGGWETVQVELLTDVRTPLLAAPRRFGPQKGATPSDVRRLEEGLARWVDVVEQDLGTELRDQPGTGAAGGLAFGLAAGIGGEIAPGAQRIAEILGLPGLLGSADLLVVGEGALDDTSFEGKAVGVLADMAGAAAVPVVAVVGRAMTDPGPIGAVEVADGAEAVGGDAAAAVAAAGRRLAATTD